MFPHRISFKKCCIAKYSCKLFQFHGRSRGVADAVACSAAGGWKPKHAWLYGGSRQANAKRKDLLFSFWGDEWMEIADNDGSSSNRRQAESIFCDVNGNLADAFKVLRTSELMW